MKKFIVSKRIVRKIKKVFAILMLPVFLLQMVSFNLLFLAVPNASADEISAPIEVTEAAPSVSEEEEAEVAPAEEAVVAEEKKVEVAPVAVSEIVTPEVKDPAPEQSVAPVESPAVDLSNPAPVVDNSVPVEPVLNPSDPSTEIVTEKVETSDVMIAEVPREIWVTDGNKSTTNDVVELNKEYKFPGNEKVVVKFTKLPENSGKITIEEIKLTKEEMDQVGSLSEKVYDITSDMADGSFELALSLPMPEGKITADQVEIKYAEKMSDLSKAQPAEKDKDVKEELDTQKDILMVKGVDHFTIFFIAATATLIPDANVAQGLEAMGPVNLITGYPEWYQDKTGLKLAFCNNPADPGCGGPLPDEAFYWSAESSVAMPGGGDAQLIMALEATDTVGQANSKAVFTRIRVRIDVPVDGEYTIVHPYGNFTITATVEDGIDETFDIDPTPGLFDQALTVGGSGGGGIGPFLKASAPSAPAGYIGSPAVLQTITGSPNDTNYFEIQGPANANFGSNGEDTVREDHFFMLGKMYVDPGVLAVGIDSQVADSLTPTINGTFGGNNPVSIAVSVAETSIGAATVNQTAKTWSIAVPAGIITTDGTYQVNATISDTVTNVTAIDVTTDELTVDRSPAPPVNNKTGLASRSPLINATTGFPQWYQDTLGNKLELCADPNNAMCLADGVIAGNTLSEQTGFGGEAFYWNGESIITFPNGGQALLVMALESAYGVGDPAPNEQMVFARIRVRIDAPIAGDYTVVHPFGSKTYKDVPAGTRTINDTIDIGTVTIGTFPGAFDSALGGNIGPFLKAVSPAPPTGYIGSPLVEQTVKGSPFGTNFFKIAVANSPGADLDGNGNSTIQKNTFTLSGKLFVEPPVGTLSVSVTPQNSNISTPVITGGVSDPTAVVSVSVGGQNVSATVNTTTGAWSALVPVALADGTYDVVATAAKDPLTATDFTTNELVVNTAPDTTGLTAVSPTAPTGFPYWYQDNSGLRLALCNNGDPNCVTTPADLNNPTSVQAGFGDEAFYWNGTSTIDLPGGGQAKLVTGLEAAYANGAPEANEQMVFTRVRINMDAPIAGTYVITHPFGTKTYVVDPADVGVDAIKDTVDIGAVSVGTLSSAFNLALNGNVGPFLTATSGAPAGYIGNPGVEQTVTGSPNNTNYFKIQGPAGSNLGGAGVNEITNNNFSLSGKIFNPVLTSINVTPANPAITAGATQQMSAAVLDQSNSPIIPAPAITWSSSNNAVASVSNTGMVTAVSVGTATITATSGGVSGSTIVTVPDVTNPTLTSYTISELIISPNASVGIKDSTSIDIAFSESVNGTIDIKDSLGNIVKNIYISGGLIANPTTKTWDGKNTAGVFVSDGVYVVSVKGIDAAGNQVLDESKTITVDNTLPIITINSTNPEDVIYGDTYIDAGATTTEGTVGVVSTVNTKILGNYAVTYDATDQAGNHASVQRTVNVVKRSLVITANDNSKIYGSVKTYGVEIFQSGLIVGDSVDGIILTSTGDIATAPVGTYPITPSVAFGIGLGNYDITYQNGTLTVTPADQTALVIVAPSTLVYGVTATLTTTGGNGTGAITYDVGSSTGCLITGDTLSVTDANGTCSVTATKAADANYSATTSQAVAVTLQKATPTITWANPADIIYGEAISTTQLNATSSGDGGPIYTPSAGAVLNVGNAQELSVTFSATNNYNSATQTVQINVLKASSTTVIICPISEIYTGSLIAPCTATATGAGGLNESVTVTYANNTNVGSATATALYAGDANHTGSTDSKTFDINVDPALNSNVLTTTTNSDGTESGIIPNAITMNITLPSGTVSVQVPANLVVTGPATWNGTIHPPAITVTDVEPIAETGTTATAVGSIEIGFDNTVLTFDKGVRILLSGQAGNLIGYSHGAGTFQAITNICSEDSQSAGDALATGADCKINVGNDLVIWTKHFSAFTTYIQSKIISNSDDNSDDDDDDDDNDKKKKKSSSKNKSSWNSLSGESNIFGDIVPEVQAQSDEQSQDNATEDNKVEQSGLSGEVNGASDTKEAVDSKQESNKNWWLLLGIIPIAYIAKRWIGRKKKLTME